MEQNIFSIELLHRGKYESWDFEDEAVRDEMYERVKKEFADKAITDKNDGVDDANVVQLSATSLQLKSDGVEQTVPYEWYEGKVFNDMLVSLNHRYEKLQ